jgi:hypothetical protein
VSRLFLALLIALWLLPAGHASALGDDQSVSAAAEVSRAEPELVEVGGSAALLHSEAVQGEDPRSPASLKLEIELNGTVTQVRLSKSSIVPESVSIVSFDEQGTQHQTEMAVSIYQGNTEGASPMSVTVQFRQGVISGTVQVESNSYELAPQIAKSAAGLGNSGGINFVLEPNLRADKDMGDEHIVDVASMFRCGTAQGHSILSPRVITPQGGSTIGVGKGEEFRLVEIVAVGTGRYQEFLDASAEEAGHGVDALGNILRVLTKVDMITRRDLGVTLTVPEVVIFKEGYGPYFDIVGESRNAPLAFQVFDRTKELLDDPSSVLSRKHRDVTLVFAAISFLGPGGVASSIGLNSGRIPYAVAKQGTSRNSVKAQNVNAVIMAHELGHLLGAPHSTGSQGTVALHCPADTPTDTLMRGDGVLFNDVDLRFSECSQDAIRSSLEEVEFLGTTDGVVVCGDVSRDGRVTIGDALAILRLAVEGGYDGRADTSLLPYKPDRHLFAGDALSVLRAVVTGKEDELLCAASYEFPEATRCRAGCFGDEHCGAVHTCEYLDDLCLLDCLPLPRDGCTFECEGDYHCFASDACVFQQDPCVKTCVDRDLL